MFEEIQIGGAESERQIRRQRAGESEAARGVDHVVDADFFGEFDGRDVARTGQRAAQGDETLEFVVVVVRRVGLAAADRGEGRVEDGVKGSEALLDRGRIDIDLERAAHLALGLDRAIEFRFAEIVTADHGFDFAGTIVDREQRRLRAGVLFELHL